MQSISRNVAKSNEIWRGGATAAAPIDRDGERPSPASAIAPAVWPGLGGIMAWALAGCVGRDIRYEVQAMPDNRIRRTIATLCSVAMALGTTTALAQKKYDTGASDTEIKIGNIAPYTGTFAEYAAEARAEAAYLRMINDRGGINGRKINLVSVDAGADPGKSLRLAKQLVEQEGVLALFGTFGNAANVAIRAYANEAKVPQLFVQSSSSVFDDPARFPWTMGFLATFRTETLAYAKYILQTRPEAKIGVLYANDETGKEYLAGLREGLGERASTMIVKEAVFKYAEPATVDAQVDALKNSGADVVINLAVGTAATQAIRKAYDSDWHPMQFIPNASLSVAAFLEPAGLDKASGVVSNARSKGWTSAQSRSDPAVAEYLAWMRTYNPDASLRDQINVTGYERAQLLVEVLKKCGDDLTRANVMRQAASLDLQLAMLRPGIRVTTSATDYQPIKQLYLVRFNGKDWVPLGVVAGR
jgi:branched-chain amino acid transport system substrate-binding protein